MASESAFGLSGLRDLTPINWNNEHHRRCVAASLVQGVYTLERVRQGSKLANDPSWWESFGFQLLRKLRDERDDSFFGAVYEYNNSTSIITPNTPRYIIAFRGTLLKPNSGYRDIKLNLKVGLNELEGDRRYLIAKQVVDEIISKSCDSNVWLAGHSLGSAIALLVGKKMVKMGGNCSPTETYLFNPPFISNHIEDCILEQVSRIVKSIVRATGSAGATNLMTHQHESFSELASWMPHLFVNQSDPICFGYIEYFEHRETIVEKHTIRSLIPCLFWRESEPLHLIPSAHLTININKSPFPDSHGLHQWWKSEDHYESKSHQFSEK